MRNIAAAASLCILIMLIQTTAIFKAAVRARAYIAVLSAGTGVLLVLDCICRAVASATTCICFLGLQIQQVSQLLLVCARWSSIWTIRGLSLCSREASLVRIVCGIIVAIIFIIVVVGRSSHTDTVALLGIVHLLCSPSPAWGIWVTNSCLELDLDIIQILEEEWHGWVKLYKRLHNLLVLRMKVRLSRSNGEGNIDSACISWILDA